MVDTHTVLIGRGDINANVAQPQQTQQP